MITVLAGGVGAARYLRGLLGCVDPRRITAVVNTGDDTEIHGLAISPDLDTITYTLAEAIDPVRGWGLRDESWRAMEALARYGPSRPPGSRAGETWFNLGDQDLATHLYRTARLREGARLSEVTAEVVSAWDLRLRLLPMSDDPVRTRLRTAEGVLGFQEYFVARHHDVAVTGIEFAGSGTAEPAPGVLAALTDAERIVIAPSNPLVSIAPIRSLRGVDDALRARRDHVVAISPIVAGVALKGPADRLLTELGHESSVVGIARLYASVCATLVIDTADAHHAPEIEAHGMRCVVVPTIMSSPELARDLAATTLADHP